MRVLLNRLRQTMSSRLWAWPLVTGLLGVALASLLANFYLDDDHWFSGYLWPGDTEATGSMPSFITSSVLTVLTTTISMTLIVLQVRREASRTSSCATSSARPRCAASWRSTSACSPTGSPYCAASTPRPASRRIWR